MKKILLFCLFIIGISFALLNFKGLANQGTYNSIILDFREDIPSTKIREDLQQIAKLYNQEANLNSAFSIADQIYILEGGEEFLKSIQNSSLKNDTEYIEPNYIYNPLEQPNDPDYHKQWNLKNINIESAWDDSQGEGITVAVIDTGVTPVPDLQKTEFVAGYDFVNDKINAYDDQGHGTHVAGTIAQSTNNNYGVAGVAYKAKIMPIKVLSASGGGTISDIAEGIKFAADHEANVINMSLGGGGASRLMEEAINYAYNKGVVIVAAAGNSNENSSSYPARYPKVISVSALDSAGEKAPYSNFGAGVDISAPGGSEGGKIIQETIDPDTGNPVFEGFQGTSMASPHVAGVVALIKASGVSNPEDVLQILKTSSVKVKEDPLNHFGSGKLDAGSAVKLALKGQITFKDFFRWLRDNGYLSPRFWIDGGAVALLPKILMVIGSYLLAWILRNYFPFRWNWSLTGGIVAGSCGFFPLQGFYIFDLPQWGFRLMGSSIPELGNVVMATSDLNPIFASVLIPFILIALFAGHEKWKWFALGASLGVASCLIITAFMSPTLWGLGSGALARGYLIANAVLCIGLGRLVIQERIA